MTVWDRQAENCCQYLKKGSAVHVEGSLKMDTWDDKTTGEKRSKIKVAGRARPVPRPPRRCGGAAMAPTTRSRRARAAREPRRGRPRRAGPTARATARPRRRSRPEPPAAPPRARRPTTRSRRRYPVLIDPIESPVVVAEPDAGPSDGPAERRTSTCRDDRSPRSESWPMAKMTDKKPAKAKPKAKAKAPTKAKAKAAAAAKAAGATVRPRPSASRASSAAGTTRRGPRTATCRSS